MFVSQNAVAAVLRREFHGTPPAAVQVSDAAALTFSRCCLILNTKPSENTCKMCRILVCLLNPLTVTIEFNNTYKRHCNSMFWVCTVVIPWYYEHLLSLVIFHDNAIVFFHIRHGEAIFWVSLYMYHGKTLVFWTFAMF